MRVVDEQRLNVLIGRAELAQQGDEREEQVVESLATVAVQIVQRCDVHGEQHLRAKAGLDEINDVLRSPLLPLVVVVADVVDAEERPALRYRQEHRDVPAIPEVADDHVAGVDAFLFEEGELFQREFAQFSAVGTGGDPPRAQQSADPGPIPRGHRTLVADPVIPRTTAAVAFQATLDEEDPDAIADSVGVDFVAGDWLVTVDVQGGLSAEEALTAAIDLATQQAACLAAGGPCAAVLPPPALQGEPGA